MPEVMTATPPVPRTAAAASKRLFTREEYQAMGRAGVLDKDERVELLGGEIIVMAAMGNRHAACVLRLTNTDPGETLAPSALPDLRLDVASIIPARSRS